MKIFSIVFYSVLREFRDRKSLALMLLFPVVLIFILGNALATAFVPGNLGATNVAYLNLDQGESTLHFQEFLETDEMKEIIKLNYVDSYDEAIEMIRERRISGFIFIDKDFTKSMEKGEKPVIQVIGSQHGTLRKSIIESIVNGYVNRANASFSAIQLNGVMLPFENTSSIENMSVSVKGKTPSAMDYYGITMLVMIMMYGIHNGIQVIAENKFQAIGARMRTTPTKNYELYIAKTLGSVFTLFLQALILVFFTKYAFGVNWGNQIINILFACLTLAVLATVFGIFICLVAPSKQAAHGIVGFIVPAFTFVAGGYFKIPYVGILDKLRYLSPNYLAQTVMFNQIYGGSTLQIQQNLIALWAIIILMFTMSFIAGRRQVQ